MKIYIPMVIVAVSLQILLLGIIQNSEGQTRQLEHNVYLQNAAEYKAHMLLETKDYSHCINGYCSNEMVKDFGCNVDLPDNANNVESFVIGTGTYEFLIDALLKSEPHRNHLLGIGWYKDSHDAAVGVYTLNGITAIVVLIANCQ